MAKGGPSHHNNKVRAKVPLTSSSLVKSKRTSAKPTIKIQTRKLSTSNKKIKRRICDNIRSSPIAGLKQSTRSISSTNNQIANNNKSTTILSGLGHVVKLLNQFKRSFSGLTPGSTDQPPRVASSLFDSVSQATINRNGRNIDDDIAAKISSRVSQHNNPIINDTAPVDHTIREQFYRTEPSLAHNPVMARHPLLRRLHTETLPFSTMQFVILGPRDSGIESIAYLLSQNTGGQVKYIDHHNVSDTLLDCALEGKSHVMWSDIPDIIRNSDLAPGNIPQHLFLTFLIDYPASKTKVLSNNTRDQLIHKEFVSKGLLEAHSPVFTQYKTPKIDPFSPLTSQETTSHRNLWKFSDFDYRITITDTMTPNEIFDRIQARLSTSDSYITTRMEHTSESNAAAQYRIQELNQLAEFDPNDADIYKSQIVRLSDNMKTFSHAILRPIAPRGGLFIPDLPSPYLLNSYHMFDMDNDGNPYKIVDSVAEQLIDKQISRAAEEDNKPPSSSATTTYDNHTTKDNNDNLFDDGDDTDDPDGMNGADYAGSVNQISFPPSVLRRMVNLTYLQRIQRLVESFPLAGSRPRHISAALTDFFFSFPDPDQIASSRPLDIIKSSKEVPAEIINDPSSSSSQHYGGKRMSVLPSRPTHIIDLFTGDSASHTDILNRSIYAIMKATELYELEKQDDLYKQQLLQYKLQVPIENHKELEESLRHQIIENKLYSHFTLLSSGRPQALISSLLYSHEISPHILLLPAKEKEIHFNAKDSSRSHVNITRSMFVPFLSNIQYLQLYAALALRPKQVIPLVVPHEPRVTMQAAHDIVSQPMHILNNDEIDKKIKHGEKVHRPYTPAPISIGTTNNQCFINNIAEMSFILSGYLDMIKSGSLSYLRTENNTATVDDIKGSIGLHVLDQLQNAQQQQQHGVSASSTHTSLDLIYHRNVPRIYPHGVPQTRSQWDYPLLSPVNDTLYKNDITVENISTLFKPSVFDVTIPATHLNLLSSAIMSRDMGVPIRQFIVGVDDSHRYLIPLLKYGTIPALTAETQSKAWPINREDLAALERILYIISNRDADFIPDVISHLEAHLHCSARYAIQVRGTDEANKPKNKRIINVSSSSTDVSSTHSDNDSDYDNDDTKKSKQHYDFDEDAYMKQLQDNIDNIDDNITDMNEYIYQSTDISSQQHIIDELRLRKLHKKPIICNEYKIPQNILDIIQREIRVIYISKSDIYQTMNNTLECAGRILDYPSAIQISALNHINNTTDTSIDVDEFYNTLLQEVGYKDVLSDWRTENNIPDHRHITPHFTQEDVKTALDDHNAMLHKIEKKEENNNTTTTTTTTADASSTTSSHPTLTEATLVDDDGNDNNDDNDAIPTHKYPPRQRKIVEPAVPQYPTMFPRITIPALTLSLRHPFHDIHMLTEAYKLPPQKISKNATEPEMAAALMEQCQGIYQHALTVAREQGLVRTDISSDNSRHTNDVIIPAPHVPTLELLSELSQSSAKTLRLPLASLASTDHTSLHTVVRERLRTHFGTN